MVLARKTTLAAVCAVALALLAGCGNGTNGTPRASTPSLCGSCRLVPRS